MSTRLNSKTITYQQLAKVIDCSIYNRISRRHREVLIPIKE